MHSVSEAVPIVGYADKFSVRPGSRLAFRVDAEVSKYRATLVRLIHGNDRPGTPGLTSNPVREVEPQLIAGSHQKTLIGSFGTVALGSWQPPRRAWTLACWVWPTALRSKAHQSIMTLIGHEQEQICLQIEPGGVLALKIVDDSGDAALRSSIPLQLRSWHFVAGVVDDHSGILLYRRQLSRWPNEAASEVVRGSRAGGYLSNPAELLFAASPTVDLDTKAMSGRGSNFNGKIDTPIVINASLSNTQLDALFSDAGSYDRKSAGLIWDFSKGIDSSTMTDVSGNEFHGSLVNLPTRGVTGHLFDGTCLDHKQQPSHFGAIHFHDDDLEDASWEASFEFVIPKELPSGLYAAELTANGALQHIPFVVRPELGLARSRIAVLLPSLTYFAYGNERLSMDESIPRVTELSSTDAYLLSHPEFGSSLYDVHSDGSGNCYVSRRRPILNMSPTYAWWLTGSPAHLAADLFLLDWLTNQGFDHDVITDEDVHDHGVDLLAPYRVVITGSHPEYATGAMLDALDAYLDNGGKLMYLGGNGFYWVASLDKHRPHIMEVRRGHSGTRTWTSAPGELFHATTGEHGGLWRHRGRPPNRLTGVGFSAQGAGDRAPGFARLPDSFLPEVSFIFEGVSANEVIGDFGLALGGAAGHEVDRVDESLGSPKGQFRVATSLPHSDLYQGTVEDQESIRGPLGGSTNELVRADMTYFQHRNGGAVFSVGAITWSGSLSHNNYANNVSRITENVLQHFLATNAQASETAFGRPEMP